jgi:uncharacterized membrane protein
MTLRTAAFALVALGSVSIALYAVVAYGFFPLGAGVHPDMRAAFEAHRIGIYAHVFGAALALALGPLQFSSRLRASRPALHRWSGRLYLALGVLVGGLAGLYMSAFAFGGWVSTTGFGLLAILWLYTGARAYLAARARDFTAHREWMIRNFALALAAVTLRIYLGLGFASGLPFETFYPPLAWLSWVPNLLVAEALVRKGAPAAAGAPRRHRPA